MCKTGPDTGTYNLDISGRTSVQYVCKQKCLKDDEDRICARLGQKQGHIIYSSVDGQVSSMHASRNI